jgi:C-terminal processing protease CtpA/Prc
LIGEPTCGCVVGVRVEYVLPDGGGLRIAETGFVSARGVRMEGQPTLPTVRVTPTLADLRAGRDPVLEEAVRRLAPRPATVQTPRQDTAVGVRAPALPW